MRTLPSDGSSFHVSHTCRDGRVLKKQTNKGPPMIRVGRGQAGNLWPSTLMYRETREARYLAHAQKIAEFLLNHPGNAGDKILLGKKIFLRRGLDSVTFRDASPPRSMSSRAALS